MCVWTYQQYHNQSQTYEKAMRYINMGFTGMFSVETVLKIIGFGIKVGILEQKNKKKYTINNKLNQSHSEYPPSLATI